MKYLLACILCLSLLGCTTIQAPKKEQLILEVPAELLIPPEKLEILE